MIPMVMLIPTEQIRRIMKIPFSNHVPLFEKRPSICLSHFPILLLTPSSGRWNPHHLSCIRQMHHNIEFATWQNETVVQRNTTKRKCRTWKKTMKAFFKVIQLFKMARRTFSCCNENFSQNHYAEVYTGCVRKMYTHFENRNTKTKSLILNDSEQTSLVVFGHIKK